MLKENVADLNIIKCLHRGENSFVYLLDDGRVLKMIHPNILYRYLDDNCDFEGKLLAGERLTPYKEFIFPISVVYEDSFISGYTMEYVDCINFTQYDDTLTEKEKLDLHLYQKNYEKLEKIVKVGNELGLVFPDMCTTDNIYVSQNGDFKFGDYDGFQIDDYETISISSDLGNFRHFYFPKFFRNGLFTNELDKYSLMVLYFLDTFYVRINGSNFCESITLRDTIRTIGLEDERIIRMIDDTLSKNKKGVYVGEIAREFALNYNLVMTTDLGGNTFRRLVKKQ